jgi:predicted N-acetyltransferase YhbS
MVILRDETAMDAPAREALLDRAFGKSRHRKTSQRLRDGRLPVEGLAFSAVTARGRLIGTIRLWPVNAGTAGPALMLGPLAVDQRHQRRGIGRALMEMALGKARALGHRAVILVGDAPYYSRFGFTADAVAGLALPGPVERHRFLGLELAEGALAGATGFVSAAGHVRADKASRAA